MKKHFSPKQKKEIKKLQKLYSVRLALSLALTEKAEEIEQKILNENSFVDIDGNVIKNIKDVFLLCDRDSDKFYSLRVLEMRKAGLGHPRDNEGVSVDCVASNNVSKMKRRIFDYVMTTLPLNLRNTLEQGQNKMVDGLFVFDKVIDLFMKTEV